MREGSVRGERLSYIPTEIGGSDIFTFEIIGSVFSTTYMYPYKDLGGPVSG